MSYCRLRIKSDLEHALIRLRQTKAQINPGFTRTIRKLEKTENRILQELEKVT